MAQVNRLRAMAVCIVAMIQMGASGADEMLLRMPYVVMSAARLYCLHKPPGTAGAPQVVSLSLADKGKVVRHPASILFFCPSLRFSYDVADGWAFYPEYYGASGPRCEPTATAWYTEVRRPVAKLDLSNLTQDRQGGQPIVLPQWRLREIHPIDREFDTYIRAREIPVDGPLLCFDIVARDADSRDYYIAYQRQMHVWRCKISGSYKDHYPPHDLVPRCEKPRVIGEYTLPFSGPFAAIKVGEKVVLLDSSAKIWRVNVKDVDLAATANELLRPGVTRWIKITDVDHHRSGLGAECNGRLTFAKVDGNDGRPLLDLDISAEMEAGIKRILQAIDEGAKAN